MGPRDQGAIAKVLLTCLLARYPPNTAVLATPRSVTKINNRVPTLCIKLRLKSTEINVDIKPT